VSLLEEAKKIPSNRTTNISDDDIELAIGWLKDEVTIGQVSKIYNTSGSNGYQKVARFLRRAYQTGLLQLKDSK